MSSLKTKSIKNLENMMEGIDPASIRHRVLNSAKSFKTSWVELGQSLYAVWKDKLYKDWGYQKFETYTSKEIGIKKQTALKLLRSYYFLEREEPLYLQKHLSEDSDTATVPTYESVDVLRLASKNKEIDRLDYQNLKKKVLEKGGDAHEVRKDLTQLMRQREELEPEEAWKRKKLATVKRLVSLIMSVKKEAELSNLLPVQLIKETEKLIDKLETEVGG
jgi:hypothetical protein